MSIKDKYKVESIDKYLCKEWFLKKHYAKRVPPIQFSFGLYNSENILNGVCTFGPSCYEMENGKCIFNDLLIKVVELNRLIKNDDLEKNVTSFFVSSCIKLLPSPICIVSYADPNNGHIGFIYQATNFIFTGISTAKSNWFNETTNNPIHDRSVSNYRKLKHVLIETKQKGKHRYFYFVGSKKQKKQMVQSLKYKILSYPKGQNKNYDASYKPIIQTKLF